MTEIRRLTLKQLEKDKMRIEEMLSQAKMVAIQRDPQVNFLSGVLSYLEDNIKKLKGEVEE